MFAGDMEDVERLVWRSVPTGPSIVTYGDDQRGYPNRTCGCRHHHPAFERPATPTLPGCGEPGSR